MKVQKSVLLTRHSVDIDLIGYRSEFRRHRKCFKNYVSNFDGHDGIEVIVDDLLVWGETKEQHDERLKRALEIARSSGIKLNKDKCEIGLQEVTYIGHTLSSNGLKPDVNKVEAIRRIDTPNDKAAVQRFLGMATYLAKFIPNFSQLASPLRVLLEKNTAWHWGQTTARQLRKVESNNYKCTCIEIL